jgi:hypothetical protein
VPPSSPQAVVRGKTHRVSVAGWLSPNSLRVWFTALATSADGPEGPHSEACSAGRTRTYNQWINSPTAASL